MYAMPANMSVVRCTCTAPSLIPASVCGSMASNRSIALRGSRSAVRRRMSQRRGYVMKAADVDQSPAPTQGARRSTEDANAESPSANGRRVTATIRKPLGMVLAEAKDGAVFIESIEEGGNAAQQGDVKVGDVVRKTSATLLKEGKSGDYAKKGHGGRPYEDYEPVMFECDGEDFKTVLAAVRSNNERWGIMEVTLEVSRP